MWSLVCLVYNNYMSQENIKRIVDSFDFDKNASGKLEKQKQEIFNSWEKKVNPIKKTLDIHIEPSLFKKYYTRNAYPNGVDFYVNQDIGKFLKPFELNGKTSIIQEYDGRRFVIVQIDNLEIPFYCSSQGTDGKQKGGWYPFYGFSDSGWVMKDGYDKEGNWIYNENADQKTQNKIKQMAEELNKNISLPMNPQNFINNLDEYFSYQEIDDHLERRLINNALGLPKDFNTKEINISSGHDELIKIRNYLLKKI